MDDMHICKECGATYKYCRACTFKPIFSKEHGFCSDACLDKYNTKTVKQDQSNIDEPSIIKEEAEVKEDSIIKETYIEENTKNFKNISFNKVQHSKKK